MAKRASTSRTGQPGKSDPPPGDDDLGMFGALAPPATPVAKPAPTPVASARSVDKPAPTLEPKPAPSGSRTPRPAAAQDQPDQDAAPHQLLPTLDAVIGQDRAVRTLVAAMTCGRVHHAWIFAGPPGVGKLTTARAFAAALLDPTTQPDLAGVPRPDPDSPTQRLLAAGAYPDLHLITKELAGKSSDDAVRRSKQTSIAKEVVQEFLVEPALKARSVHSGTAIGKVFIVDEAELLNDASQNALLKTVEEPPEGTLLILITSSEERLLTTIRSRCQRVEFAPLDQDGMVEWLRRSGLDLPPIQFDWLLRIANGSPGEALLAAERGLYKWEEELGPSLDVAIRGRYALGLAAAMAKLIDEQAAAEIKRNSDASKDGANKVWSRRMLGFVGDRLRRSLRDHAKTVKPAADPPASEDPKTARLLHMLAALAEADRHIASNVNLGLALENLAAQLVAEPESVV